MRKAMNPAFSIPNLMARASILDPVQPLLTISQKLTCIMTPSDTLPVSKVTLDIICETAFGYKSDSLHNPHNDLAEAYEDLISLQSGAQSPDCANLYLKLLQAQTLPA